jgi:hypothetical protein
MLVCALLLIAKYRFIIELTNSAPEQHAIVSRQVSSGRLSGISRPIVFMRRFVSVFLNNSSLDKGRVAMQKRQLLYET